MTQVKISLSPEDIERVLREWESVNPGKSAENCLTGDEFARLILADMYARGVTTTETPDQENVEKGMK